MPFVASLNQVILVGNLTADPTIAYTQQTNTPVCRFTIATNRKYRTQAGETREEATFHPVSVWGPRAENLARILKKGDKVLVMGRLTYNRRDCGERSINQANVRVNDVIILSRKSRSGGASTGSASTGSDADIPDEATESLNLDDIVNDLKGVDEAKESEEPKDDAPEAKDKEGDAAGAEDDLPF